MNGIVDLIHDENEHIDRGYMTIPNIIVFDKNLSFLEKFILGTILSFQYYSQCNASNEWFADQFGVSVRTIERTMKRLEDYALIERQYDHGTKTRKILPASQEVWTAYSMIRRKDQKQQKSSEKDPSIYNQHTDIKELHKIWT